MNYINLNRKPFFAFNIWSIESAKAIMDAAGKTGHAVILQTSMKAFSQLDREALRFFVTDYGENWVRNHEREIFERTYRFLSPNDYLIARLTGSFVTDYMNAHKWYYDEASQAIRQSCWRNWRSRKGCCRKWCLSVPVLGVYCRKFVKKQDFPHRPG